jgi:hypothetical protein
MVEALVYPLRECNMLANEIPSIEEALRVMRSGLIHASEYLSEMQDASISLEAIILNSSNVDLSAHHEATAMRLSAHNIIDLAMSEIEERITSLEVILNRKAVIPTVLSTANDVSVAFHIAVNNSEIDWPFAEFVLERFSFLWTKEKAMIHNKVEDSVFRQDVWYNNNFDDNMVKLLQEGDCWRVRKSLNLIDEIVDDADDLTVSVDIFNSLACILLQPMQSPEEYEERKWVHLIVKNQDKPINQDTSRLIDSFLFSEEGKVRISCNVLKIITTFINDNTEHDEDFQGGRSNEDNFIHASIIPKALVEILSEKKGNTSHVIETCLQLLSFLDYYNWDSIYIDLLVDFGICRALIALIEYYPHLDFRVRYVIDVMISISARGNNIVCFTTPELFVALVEVFNSPFHYENLPIFVKRLLAVHDDARKCFMSLGIPEGSSFFGD